MPNYIWTFTAADPGSTATASNPQSNVAGGNDVGNGNATTRTPTLAPSNGGLVNVVRDYYWTYSPAGDPGRAEVPRIILTEKKLKTNSLVAQLKYTLGQTQTNTAQLASNFGATGSCIGNLIKGLGSGNNSCGSSSPSVTQDENTTTDSPLLAPYKELYITKDTGWIYYLPYFDNNQSSTNNAFSDTQAGTNTLGYGEAAASFLDKAAGVAGTAANPTQYTFIEKTKFYDYASDSGEEINVEFPLINTGAATYDDVIQNWQFLYLLVFPPLRGLPL
jgi:hypothetical protein